MAGRWWCRWRAWRGSRERAGDFTLPLWVERHWFNAARSGRHQRPSIRKVRVMVADIRGRQRKTSSWIHVLDCPPPVHDRAAEPNCRIAASKRVMSIGLVR